MGKLKKYAFTHMTKSGAKKEYRLDEHELEKEHLDILYQNFAKEWDWAPLAVKNRFLVWLAEESNKLYGDPKKNQN